MRVLVVNDKDPEDAIGGTERYVLDICEGLAATGHEVFRFTLSNRRSVDSASQRTFFVEPASRLADYRRHVFFYAKLHRALRGFIDRARPDVVHLHNNYRHPITILAALRGYPTVQTVHDYCALYPTAACTHEQTCAFQPAWTALRHGCMNWKLLATEGWLLYGRRFLDRWLIDAFIAPSKDLAEHLRSNGAANVVHLGNFTRVDEPYEPPPAERNVVLFVGALIPHKGVDVLLRAFREVEREVPNAELWVVGDGPDRGPLQALATRLGLGRVSFLGARRGPELADSYRKATAVVIPSLWLENAPLVAFEAMAHGRAVIGSKVGGIPELVRHGCNGYLFPRGDASELSTHLRKLLMNRPLAIEFGAAGKRWVTEFGTVNGHVESLTKIYANVGRARPRPRVFG